MRTAMRVTHQEGDRFTVEVRDHLLTVDQPQPDGGWDLGPQPIELFVASLASCVAHYAHRFLRRHFLGDDVTVDAEWTLGSSPPRVASITISVVAPGLTKDLEQRFVRVIEHCTVHNSITTPPEIIIGVENKDVASRSVREVV